MVQRNENIVIGIDDAFFQPDWARVCWGRWVGPELLLGGLQALDVTLLCKKE